MKLMSRVGSDGAVSKAMNVCAGKVTPTGSGTLFRFFSVAMAPSSPVNDPVAPGPILVFSVGNGGSFNLHVIVVSVTSTVPAMLKVPNMGDADRLALHTPASIAPINRLRILLPRIVY